MCIYVSFDKVIKIKFKVNGERLFLVLFLVALHFRRYEKIYIYIYCVYVANRDITRAEQVLF